MKWPMALVPQRILPQRTRIELAVRHALGPFVPDLVLPGVRLFLGDGFRRSGEPPTRAASRLLRQVDATVRRVVIENGLPEQAPLTSAEILDTVEAQLIDVHVIEDSGTVRGNGARSVTDFARFAVAGAGTIDVPHAGVLGGPHAVPPALRVPVPSVSARHAEVRIERGSAAIRDLGSRHGTVLGGKRIGSELVPIRAGQRVDLAAAQLEFVGIVQRIIEVKSGG